MPPKMPPTWPAVSVPFRESESVLSPSQMNTPEIHNQAGQGRTPNMKKVARGAKQAKNDSTPYKAPSGGNEVSQETVFETVKVLGKCTTGSERGESLLVPVPPNAGG